MSTSVTALLDETEDFKEQGSEMPEEEEQYPEDSLHGQSIICQASSCLWENVFQ